MDQKQCQFSRGGVYPFVPRASLRRAYAARLNEEITRLVPFVLLFYISIPSTSGLIGSRGFC